MASVEDAVAAGDRPREHVGHALVRRTEAALGADPHDVVVVVLAAATTVAATLIAAATDVDAARVSDLAATTARPTTPTAPAAPGPTAGRSAAG